MLWRREWQPTPVFLPREPHGQRNLVGYSPWDCRESDTTEQLTLLKWVTGKTAQCESLKECPFWYSLWKQEPFCHCDSPKSQQFLGFRRPLLPPSCSPANMLNDIWSWAVSPAARVWIGWLSSQQLTSCLFHWHKILTMKTLGSTLQDHGLPEA